MSSRTKYALLLFVCLGVVLKFSASVYDPGALAFLAASMAGMATLIYRRSAYDSEGAIEPATLEPEARKNQTLELALISAVFLFTYLLQRDPMLDSVLLNRETSEVAEEIKSGFYLHASSLQIMPVLACLLWLNCLISVRATNKWRNVLVALALIVLVIQRYATVMITPYVHIDVYVTNELACEYLIKGWNPYTQWYPDIYADLMGYPPGFGYWPGYLYWATPFKYFFNDVRYASATADILTSVVLMLVGHKLKIPFRTICLFPLVWLSFPVGMFVLEHAWIDPNLIFFISLLLLALMYERWILVGLLAGWIAGTKQYGGLVGIMTLAYIASQHRRQLIRVTLASAAMFAALLGPYLLLDWRAFYNSTIGVLANAPLRKDPLSLVGLWLNVTTIKPSGEALAAVALAVNLSSIGGTAWWLFRSRDKSPIPWVGGLMFCYFVFFFTGKFAYCNYYYLVSFFVLSYFVLALGDDMKQAPPAVAESTV